MWWNIKYAHLGKEENTVEKTQHLECLSPLLAREISTHLYLFWDLGYQGLRAYLGLRQVMV